MTFRLILRIIFESDVHNKYTEMYVTAETWNFLHERCQECGSCLAPNIVDIISTQLIKVMNEVIQIEIIEIYRQ